MPELPEVETVKSGLQKLVGKKIVDIIVRFPRLRYPLDKDLLHKTKDALIKSVTRRAKYIIIETTSGYLVWHLGMSGRITVYNTDDVPEIVKHDHVDVITENFIVRYNDPRRFGCLIYAENLTSLEMINTLGPEPLEDDFSADYLFNSIKTRKTPIKQLIMDNSIVVGVGNIYACESLFLCKISPLRLGNQISPQECNQLVEIIRKVLKAAIAAGGSSLRDYKNADGELGYFQQSHNVYGRAKQECKVCKDNILEVRLGQRNSFYCPSCQT